MRANILATLIWSLCFVAPTASWADAETNEIAIRIHALGKSHWRAEYTLTKPAAKLLFGRSPDASRAETWNVEDGFEIVSTADGEIARRKDGRAFRELTVQVPPVYRMLPKDYAPFSPFGDGGMAMYTGRFFACADACVGEQRWKFDLRADKDDHIIVNDKRVKGRASWIDKDDGRVVYIGATEPLATPELIAVIDGALPEAVRTQLFEQLPAFMQHFAVELDPLDERPMLFVSYDLSHPKGWGRQGGVLPGQIFIHFYGNHWREEVKQPSFANDLAWHFAHEAAHLFQRHLYAREKGEWWIHEGAADAFAAIVLRGLDSSSSDYIDSRIAGARSACAEQLGAKGLAEAIESGTFDVAYTCGLVVNFDLHERMRRSGNEHGLYAVWREYLKLARETAPGKSAYLAAIAQVAPTDVVERVRAIFDAKGQNVLGLTTQ